MAVYIGGGSWEIAVKTVVVGSSEESWEDRLIEILVGEFFRENHMDLNRVFFHHIDSGKGRKQIHLRQEWIVKWENDWKENKQLLWRKEGNSSELVSIVVKTLILWMVHIQWDLFPFGKVIIWEQSLH